MSDSPDIDPSTGAGPIDPDWVNSLEYKTLVAPALKVGAATAASRGEPWLATDLASMIAVLHLVRLLVTRYDEEWGGLGEASPPETLAKVPEAALAMVLKEAEFEPSAVGDCIDAVQRAYAVLRNESVIPETEPMVDAAWRALTGNDEVSAETLLGAVAGNVVSAVDAWEGERDGAARH